MFDRFNLGPLFVGHWRGLTKDTDDGPVPDWPARCVVAGVPVLVLVVAALFRVSLSSPSVLLTAVSLLTGGGLSVFAQLSSLRLKLTEWCADDPERDADKAALDESIGHLLTATTACIIDAAVLVTAMTLAPPDQKSIGGVLAYLAAGITTYVGLVFLMLIPRLYYAYTAINDVRDDLNGFTVDRTKRKMRRMRR